MATWKIDTRHSRIQFKIRHLMVSHVVGEFTKYDGTVESSKKDFTDAQISFEADVDSINTGDEQRDGHLKSPDFFNAAAFPKIKFVSTDIKKVDSEDYKLTGNFTMLDKTLPITFDVVFGGIGSMGNHTAAGFEITGKINRKDFGLKWNAATEAGGIAVGEDVKVDITVELVEQV
jgi:polyisoprenoid-binding protein YceI